MASLYTDRFLVLIMNGGEEMEELLKEILVELKKINEYIDIQK